MIDSKYVKYFFRKSALIFALISTLLSVQFLSACSTTTIPWPTLSISHEEADDGLSKQEQSLLAELLDSSQKNHQKEALKEIEGR